MRPFAIMLAFLAAAFGERSPTRQLPSEETRGSLRASLTVPRTVSVGHDAVFQVTLRNVSSERQSFLLEPPGAFFFVKTAGGSVVWTTHFCPQPWTCPIAAVAHPVTIEAGGNLQFVEHWNFLGMNGRRVPSRWYRVAVKLRAYRDTRSTGAVDAGSFEPFRLQADIFVTQDTEAGR